MMQTSTHNDHLFRADRHRQEAQAQTLESSWLTAPREGWTQLQEQKRSRLSNSPEGRKVNGYFILAHVKTGGRL